ncbi:MAG: Panacea domain-containing protein [Pirellulales bacterium]
MVKVKVPSRSPDDKKLRELILYICHRSEGDATFGATKLNKLLFYCDFLAYTQFGRAITWHTYQRLPNGPAPVALLPITKDMERRKEIAIGEHNYYGHKQKRTLALRDADLSVFRAEEIALVEEVIEECRGINATRMSLLSHGFRGWQLAENGENIPYEVALVDFERPTEKDLALAMSMGEELKALAAECKGND